MYSCTQTRNIFIKWSLPTVGHYVSVELHYEAKITFERLRRNNNGNTNEKQEHSDIRYKFQDKYNRSMRHKNSINIYIIIYLWKSETHQIPELISLKVYF